MRLHFTFLSALLVLGIMIAGCGERTEQVQHRGASLEGAWRSSVQFQSGAFATITDLEFMYVFNQGGTMTESSNYDGAPPTPPAYGVWKELADKRFEAKYEFFMTRTPDSSDGLPLEGGFLPAGRGILTETITLSEDGESFSSTIRLELFNRRGEPEGGGGDAVGRGMRISL